MKDATEIKNNLTISTLIPVYQDSGLPIEILEQTLKSVLAQSHPASEVIVSDDSSGEWLRYWIEEFNLIHDSSIIYLKNPTRKGVSSNSNYVASQAKGELIHFLHSDDQLASKYVYEEAIMEFSNPSCKWLLLPGRMGETFTWPNLETLNLFGINTVGGPSALIIRKILFENFNEEISMLMDIEFFNRASREIGPPFILKELSIEYGSGSWQLQRSLNEKSVLDELSHLWRNKQINYSDFRALFRIPDCWDVKRTAFKFLRFHVKLKKTRKLRFWCRYSFEVAKFVSKSKISAFFSLLKSVFS